METGLVLAGGLAVLIGVLSVRFFRGRLSWRSDAWLDREFARCSEALNGLNPRSDEFLEAARARDAVLAELDRRKRHRKPKAQPAIDRSPEWLRSIAETAYEEGWHKAESVGKEAERCHETALVNVLYERMQSEPGSPAASEVMFQAFMLESMPFSVMPVRRGREAMVEYMVWREFPEAADATLIELVIKEAVERMQAERGDNVVVRLEATPLPWMQFLG
jgi:hypothetical protein